MEIFNGVFFQVKTIGLQKVKSFIFCIKIGVGNPSPYYFRAAVLRSRSLGYILFLYWKIYEEYSLKYL
ncbi:hypothetical protein D1164_09205 [Mariniphaga sediminis]|uniref:Uncharacterized protein n=1 Tax=Mariniphaga sediminis TaxID=1628158 RepID=A0A399D3K2_9BACT|nr:hypothetical protein D1164_09205 [Mariniphaga sediminis]